MKRTTPILSLGLFAVSLCHGTAFLSDNFNGYNDGILMGQGDWVRQASMANPSNYPGVSSEAAFYDWNNIGSLMTPSGVRIIYGSSSADAISTGWLYASFDINVSVAPITDVTGLPSLRPGFFAFSSSDGSAHRGRVGINPGSTADTFLLGVSSGSQLQSNFSFSTTDLALNTTYKVVIGYDTETTAAQLWIDPVDQSAGVVASAAAANSLQGIRRVVLNLDNSDGAGGFSQMGVFTLDNLLSATTLAEVGVPVPEPATYAFLFGLATLAVVMVRRRR